MDTALVHLLSSIAALMTLAVLAYATIRNGRPSRLTALAVLAFAFILAGVLLGAGLLIGYVLLGLGMALALIDIIRKSRGAVG